MLTCHNFTTASVFIHKCPSFCRFVTARFVKLPTRYKYRHAGTLVWVWVYPRSLISKWDPFNLDVPPKKSQMPPPKVSLDNFWQNFPHNSQVVCRQNAVGWKTGTGKWKVRRPCKVMDEDSLKLKQRDCEVSTCAFLELIRHVCTQLIPFWRGAWRDPAY